eukprot:6035018-Amphidinium_carterae.4
MAFEQGTTVFTISLAHMGAGTAAKCKWLRRQVGAGSKSVQRGHNRLCTACAATLCKEIERRWRCAKRLRRRTGDPLLSGHDTYMHPRLLHTLGINSDVPVLAYAVVVSAWSGTTLALCMSQFPAPAAQCVTQWAMKGASSETSTVPA